MAEMDEERIQIANRVRKNLAIENTLSVTQARAFVRCLQVVWQVPPIQWGEHESLDLLADARRLLHAAEIFQQVNGPSSPGAIDCYRRAGESLEWLSRAKDKVSLIAPVELFAAAAFQLGGQPAMAMGLLGQMAMNDPGSQLYASFLRADFDGVMHLVTAFWRQNSDLTDRDAPRRLLNADDDGALTWHFTVELVRSLGLIADSLRRGESSRLARAIDKLDALEKMATRTFSEDASLLITLMHAVADSYRKASIYLPIGQLANINIERKPRLMRFARDQFSRGRGILWSSQLAGLERLLNEKSFALCTPTGSGKTLVANLALVKELILPQEGLVSPLALYLVPSRALAGEVEAKLRSELGLDLIVTGLYGGADWGITDYWLKTEKPTVLIATVEKAEALMRYIGPLLLARLRLLIVDEAHQVVLEDNSSVRADFAEHSSRSLRLEGFVSRLLSQAPDIARIALTAVAGGAAAPVARWIEGRHDANAIGTQYRSTRQLIGVFETTPKRSDRILLDIMNGKSLYVREREEPVYLPLRTPIMPQLPPTMRGSIFRFNELSVLWSALHLIDEERRILIFVAQEPEQTMRWYKEAFDLPEWGNIPHFVIPQGHRGESFSEARAAAVDYCGGDSYEVALLDRGIATSHGQMPQRLRRLMTEMIDQRICPITVATATLTEGVNLPFDLIFLTSLKRRSFDPNANPPQLITTPLSTAEFRNLAGRAGRPGATRGLEGMTLVALPKAISTTANGQKKNQLRQLKELENDYNQLRENLLIDEMNAEAVLSPLALLLEAIAERAEALFGLNVEKFLVWLEEASPGDISDDAGKAATSSSARLADSLDELDGVLFAALEELDRSEKSEMDGAKAEAYLIDLWQKTFTKVAAVQEGWLETAFIRRGCALVETIYPDPDERKRLYLYGFTPYVGQRFEQVAQQIHEIIESAIQYGNASDEDRLAQFKNIADLLASDRGFGFRVRDTMIDQFLLEDRDNVLAWWMQGPNAASPAPNNLRSWQRFAADNLEFRLGVAIGAVVARAWSDGANDPLAIPSLEKWRDTTGLPWFGFWARELLRWGTLDPFVAFVLAQGLSRTRSEGRERRSEFESWLSREYKDIEPDDMIDPQLFLEWQRSLPRDVADIMDNGPARVEVTGTDGRLKRYGVVPVKQGGKVSWIDAAGFELATSNDDGKLLGANTYRDDFEIRILQNSASVRRVFPE